MATSNIAKILAGLQNYPSLDPKAVLAIASHEGLGGGIGDNGTSFGPFQLHYGGAYPSSAPQGPVASQAWAWSPQGINYALGQINQVAGGLKGNQAIYNISSRFERPADVAGEVSDAESKYNTILSSGGAGSSVSYSAPGSPATSPTTSQQLTGAPTASLTAFAKPTQTIQQVVGNAAPQAQLLTTALPTIAGGFSQELAKAASALASGQQPDLKSLFSMAMGYQKTKQILSPKAAPLGGGGKLRFTAGKTVA